MKSRRDLKPDAQAFDTIIIKTIPRFKDSYLSGSEWRIHAETEFYRKGKLVKSVGCSNIQNACYLVGAKHMEACDNAEGYFAGEGDICDQEGCNNLATYKHNKKFDYCRDGHKSESPANAYRLFCDRHKNRGDGSYDDENSNYDVEPYQALSSLGGEKGVSEFLIDIVKKSDFDTVSQKLELAMNCLNNISDNNNEEIALQLSEWAREAIQKIEAL